MKDRLMGIQTEADVRDGYLYLSCSGAFSSDALLRVFEEGFTIAKGKELSAVLVDARGLGGPTPSTLQRFALAELLSDMQRKQVPHIKFFLVGDEPFVDHQKFGETVALNRGASGKVFTNIDEAVNWIEQLTEEI